MKRIKTGDKIRIISGDLMGSEGIVLSIQTKNQTAIIEGLNKAKVHTKPNAKNEDGGIKEKEMPIHLSKLALIAPKAVTGTSKIKYVINKDSKKVRVAKKTNAEIGAKK